MTTDSILAPLATIHAPDAGQLNTRAHAALTMVESMVIDSQETYDLAADELKAIKSKSTTLETQRTAITGPINKALKAVNDLFRGPAQYLEQAEKIIKSKMLTYSAEQERIAAEERRKAEALVRAEQERMTREAAAKEAAAKAEADALLAAAREKEAAAKAEADALVAAGRANEAAAMQEQAAKEAAEQAEKAAEVQANAAIEAASLAATAQVMTAPVVEVSVAKVSGISQRSVWKAECTDKAALIAYIAANPAFLNLVEVNASALNQMAKAMKDTMQIPGIRAFEEKTLAASRA